MMIKFLNRLAFVLLICFSISNLNAQDDASLNDMQGFMPQSGNWRIVGEVVMERTMDIHKKEEEPSSTRKRRKRKRDKKETEPRKAVTYTEGTGILLNYPTEDNKDNLLTAWEHGDLKLELEVMLPKGSNSGIYLQGRYEVQLFDSWGVKSPKFSDIGGIYRNWEEAPEKMFLGIAPLANAAKAPGLWQKLKIDFEAPKFDKNGNKIANAKLVSVSLNGKVIHQNVEIPRPTGGPISKEEVAMGPLMIQGDHGPVAFRNLKIRRLASSKVAVYDLEASFYQGEVDLAKGLDSTQLRNPVQVKNIDITQFDLKDNYWVTFDGKINIPKKDTYEFSMGLTGGIQLYIDNVLVDQIYSKDRWGTMDTAIALDAGEHRLHIINMKAAPWHSPRLGMTVQTASTKPKVFNAYDSDPPIGNLVSPILVDVEKEPKTLRGFVFFNEDGEKLSHTIGVGTPQGVHFIYDLECGNMVGAWRGDFVDATPMWHNRGNGSFRPAGVTVWTFLNQPLAALSTMQQPFPDNDTTDGFQPKGYTIDADSGLPIFTYKNKNVSIKQKIYPDKTGNSLVSELNFSEQGLTQHYYKLAEGDIKKLPDGSYMVNDAYYVQLLTNQNPMIRELNKKQELLVPITGAPLQYKTIW